MSSTYLGRGLTTACRLSARQGCRVSPELQNGTHRLKARDTLGWCSSCPALSQSNASGASLHSRQSTSGQEAPGSEPQSQTLEGGMTARELARSISGAKSIKKLIHLYDCNKQVMDHMHLAALTHRAGKIIHSWKELQSRHLWLIDEVAEKLMAAKEDLDARAIADCMLAWGQIGHCPGRGEALEVFMEEFLTRISPKVEMHDITNVLVCLARLKIYKKVWVEKLCGQIVAKYQGRRAKHAWGVRAQHVSSTCWALAVLGHRDDQVLAVVCELAMQRLPSSSSQALSSTLWGFAKLGYRDESFIQWWCEAAGEKLPEFNCQELANTFYALAALGIYNRGFVSELCEMAKGKLKDFNSQDLANIIWSLAKINHRDHGFIRSLCNVIPDNLHSFAAQGLANTLWALGKLRHGDRHVTTVLCQEAAWKLRNFEPKALSMVVWALATLGHDDKHFLQTWCEVAMRKVASFNPQDVANSLWALATLNYYHQEFVSRCCERARKMAISHSDVHIRQVLSALLHFDHPDDALVDALEVRLKQISSTLEARDLTFTETSLARLRALGQRLVKQTVPHQITPASLSGNV